MKILYRYSFLLLLLLMASCERSLVEPDRNTDKQLSLRNSSNSSTNINLNYGGAIRYLSERQNTLHPIGLPVGQLGRFSATPAGLAIDSLTGRIDMANSETGMWFTVKLTTFTGHTFQTKLMVSGIDYAPGIHYLSQGQKTLVPVYNAGANRMPQGFFASEQGIVVRENGTIDLEATAPSIPLGSFREVAVNYRLNDASRGAQNKIKVRIWRFVRLSDVPASLLSKVLSGGRIEEGTKERGRPEEVVIIGV